MTEAINLGSVLGGRYKVTGQVETTAAGDQVLEGRDQVLGRRVSILVAGAEHPDLLIANAREVATGSRSDHLQILDLGQSEEVTYLITSHAPADELLDLLLTTAEQPEDTEALGSDIFGDDAGPTETGGDYEQLDGSEDDASEDEDATGSIPAVRPWTEEDYAAYEEQPPAPRQTPRSGSGGGTLFDRAATDAAGGAAGASAASLREQEDGTYDGDNSYDYSAQEELDPAPAEGWQPQESVWEDVEDYDEDPEDYLDEEDEPRRRRPSPGLWITALVVLVLLVALVFFGFSRLSSMISSFGGGSESTVSGSESGSQSAGEESEGADATGGQTPTAEASEDDEGAEPELTQVSRLVPDNPSFMADGDATLGQTVDGNDQTAWLSYGFSNAQFGSLISGFGLAAELEEPAKVSTVTIDQQGGTGGSFTVYVSDSPSLDGATEAGSGTFDSPQITVELSEEAQQEEAQYVILFVDEAPQLAQPIGGYSYGVRIAEISAD